MTKKVKKYDTHFEPISLKEDFIAKKDAVKSYTKILEEEEQRR